MKNLFKSLLIFAAAAMSFSACVKPEVENLPNEEDFYYTFVLGSPETRSILDSDENGKFGKWESGDKLGTIVSDGNPGYSNVKIGTPVTFSIYKEGGLKVDDVIYAYYPHNSATESKTNVSFMIPESQSQVGDVFDFDAMPMVAEGFVVTEGSTTNQTPIGEINLLNLGSVIDFQVFSTNSTYAEETILSVKFSASGAIAGGFTKDISAVKANDATTLNISGYTEKDVTTTVTNASTMGATRDAAAHVYMVIAPTTGITGSVVVTTNKAVYTFNMTTAQTFKRAGLKSFGLNLGTCQNREANDLTTTTFVFNTTEGIQALGIELPSPSNGTNVERAVSDFIVLNGDKGTHDLYPRVWNSNGNYNFRVNKNNTISFSITEGTIKRISFNAGEKFNLTVTDGVLTGTNWEGSASTVTFTNTDTDRTDINTITVSYTGGVAPIEPVTLVMSDITCDDSEENETSLTFSWTAVENAEGYQVSTDGGNTFGETQSDLSYTWTDLIAGTEYTIYVKAVGNGTEYITSEAKSQTGKTKEGEIVGVQWVETALSDLSNTDVVVIVGNNFAMTNDNGTDSAPATVAVTVSGNKLIGDIDENIKWNVSVSNGNCTIYPNGKTDKWLYCSTTAESGSNNNMKVGTGDRKVFALNSDGKLETNDTYKKRYLSIYNNQDWRGYINTNTAPIIKFYKKVGNEPTPTTYSITISDGIQNGSVNASKTSEITAGESITLTATPTDATNWEFDSWSITGITLTETQKTTNPLTIQMPESNITVSASFKEKETSGDEDGTVFTWSATTNTSLEDGSETATDGSGTVVAWAKNDGGTKVALNVDGMRLYQKNSFTVSNSSKKIVKIDFTIKVNAKSGAFPAPSVEVGSLTSITSTSTSMTWTGSSNEVAVTMGSNSGNVAISKIVVTYE